MKKIKMFKKHRQADWGKINDLIMNIKYFLSLFCIPVWSLFKAINNFSEPQGDTPKAGGAYPLVLPFYHDEISRPSQRKAHGPPLTLPDKKSRSKHFRYWINMEFHDFTRTILLPYQPQDLRSRLFWTRMYANADLRNWIKDRELWLTCTLPTNYLYRPKKIWDKQSQTQGAYGGGQSEIVDSPIECIKHPLKKDISPFFCIHLGIQLLYSR